MSAFGFQIAGTTGLLLSVPWTADYMELGAQE